MKRKLGSLMVLAVGAGAAASVAAAAASPSVSTDAATKVKDASAVLNGRVNPNGSETRYWFVWGLTTAYGSAGAKHSAGAGQAPVSVHASIGRLHPGTRYHYRLFAQNRYGLTAGADRTLTTTGHPLPGVITGAVIDVSASGAILTGTVIPNKQVTRWQFQYGLSAELYGVTTAGGTVPASTGTSPVTVTEPVSGLQAGTTFHFRLVAVHSGFPSSNGLDQAFTTFPAIRPYAGLRASSRPRRARRKPFVFTTTGSVTPSPLFPSAVQCNGLVAIRYFLAHRQVARVFAAVQPNCTFAHQARFAHTFAFAPGHKRPRSERLRIQVRFRGNGYLAPRRARDEQVSLR